MPYPLAELNQAVLYAEYAVRGAIVQRAAELETELRQRKPLPFDRVTYLNIGNPMQLGMKYARFTREFISLVSAPHLLNQPGIEDLYDPEAIQRARVFYAAEPGGIGHYTNPKGFYTVRKEVAQFLKKRDGYAADPEHIFLTNGASSAIKDCIQLMSGPEAYQSAFMIPVPQYPLYDATIRMNCCAAVPYYLNEENAWSVDVENIVDAYTQFTKENPEIKIRGLIVINPNNPCGSVLLRQKIEELIVFCAEKDIPIFADEVYYVNLYEDAQGNKPEFYSFKRIMREYEERTDKKGPMLMSFHSVSKGVFGECGLRGGYVEVCNAPAYFIEQLYKLTSFSLCANTVGQLAVSVMVNPPASLLYHENCAAQLASMYRKAYAAYQRLSATPHMSCQPVQGSMYAFPNVELPKKFLVQCFSTGKKPDAVYCMKLLEYTGICTVNGAGFLQKENTYHFRMSILEAEDRIPGLLDAISKFHVEFWRQWS